MKLNQILQEDGNFSFDTSAINNDMHSVLFNPPADIQPAIAPQQSTNAQPENPPDIITIDVPLFIRLLEWAKEEATDDMQLHDITEKIVAISGTGQSLSMENYDDIISGFNTNKKVHKKR